MEGRVVLVTGGTGSIGRVVAGIAAAGGWTVIVHGRTDASAARVAAALSAQHPAARIVPVAADFLSDGAVPDLLRRIETGFGRLDGIVHCAVSAPTGVTGPFGGTDPGAFTALCHHAITTLWWLCQAAFPLMAKGGGGSLVAISSDAGRFAAPNQSLIAATRAAAMAFCRNVALEVSRDGIRVNCVAASHVEDTAIVRAMTEAGSGRAEAARRRAGLGLPHPRDIANMALFLIGEGSTHVTGQVISVNGGLNA